jgi:aryl-alcohol dehydrogenase-like predicted oxidoreductase
VSNVSAEQVVAARSIAPVVAVQNFYNLAVRADDALVDHCAEQGIAFVPFFPLGGFRPLQSGVLDEVAAGLGISRMQVALAWLLQRSPTILLIPGTSNVAHLRENAGAADVELPAEAVAALNAVGTADRSTPWG